MSDGWGSPRDGDTRKHRGADIGYRRNKGELPQFIAGTRQASHGGMYVCPDGTPVLAAADGTLWNVSTSDNGIQIVIDHGKPWATYYQHLRSTSFAFRSGGKNPERVRAGQILGYVGNGYNPGSAAPDAYNHAHFEVWQGGGAESAINPAPILARASHGSPTS